jgi:hypothetical protein
MFSAEDILARLRNRPFIPIRIVTTTGESYDIPHPELALVTRRFVEVGIPESGNPAVADQITRVAMIHITELRELPVPAPPPTNGPPG